MYEVARLIRDNVELLIIIQLVCFTYGTYCIVQSKLRQQREAEQRKIEREQRKRKRENGGVKKLPCKGCEFVGILGVCKNCEYYDLGYLTNERDSW